MAAKAQSVHIFRKRANTKRKGIHAKTKSSKNKNSTKYDKPYASQGR
jgi:hypothetical protein